MNQIPRCLSFTAVSLLGLAAAHGYELKYGTNLPPVDIHAFASQGFLYSSDYNYLGDSSDGSFRFTEMGINASFNPFPRTRITAQGFLFAVGDIGDYEPFLDYASIEYTFADYFGMRGGRVRKPGGIYNHIQDVDLARTWVLLPQGIYDARWRDFSTSLDGGLVFGNTSLAKAGSLSYEAFGGLLNVSEEGGLAKYLQEGLTPQGGTLNSVDPAIVAGTQLWWTTPADGLRVGALAQYLVDFSYDFAVQPPFPVPPMPANASIDGWIYQASLEYVWKAWTFQSEYSFFDLEQRTEVTGAGVSTSPARSDSWFVSAAYRFNRWLEVGSYYTEYYPNTSSREGSPDAYQKDVALSFRFDPTDWLILKVEGHCIRGTALLRDSANNPTRDDDPWFMLATKATVSF